MFAIGTALLGVLCICGAASVCTEGTAIAGVALSVSSGDRILLSGLRWDKGIQGIACRRPPAKPLLPSLCALCGGGGRYVLCVVPDVASVGVAGSRANTDAKAPVLLWLFCGRHSVVCGEFYMEKRRAVVVWCGVDGVDGKHGIRL